MTKITLEHLARGAIVYVRQSSLQQVTNNVESRRRQYGLVERAHQLGWSEARVIDDDLGRSGAGGERPGFEKLLAAICEGNVGAVLSVEASRLARNGRDWHTLLEFCGVVGTLIVDEDGVYDPRSPNDRLLLGMKGTMSEMELSMFRQRSLEARKQKARRGELLLTVAVGYTKTDDDRIEKNADRRVQDAIGGKGGQTQRYFCRGAFDTMAVASCISFGGMRIDRAIAQEVLTRLQPLGVEAALAALEAHGQEQSQKRRQVENALGQARFEAARAHRQYNAVDPENRLVVGELERRWNERLASVQMLEDQLVQMSAPPRCLIAAEDRERLLTLGADLTLAWNRPGVSAETRKKIIRLLIHEIIVDTMGDTPDLIIHWQGGDHTRLQVKKNKAGRNRWATEADVADLVRVLARQMPDQAIALVLNRSGKSTGRGNSWTRIHVCSLRSKQGIAPYRDGERRERGEATLLEAAETLAVSTSSVLRMIRAGTLPANQLCKGAPRIIRLCDLQNESVRHEAMPAAHESRCLAIRFSKLLIYKEMASWALRNAIGATRQERRRPMPAPPAKP